MRQRYAFDGVYLLGDPEAPFRYLPFDVPPGTKRIEVSYHWERPEEGGGDVVDLGIFDARGTEFLAGGFRGWSGSDRTQFFITRDDATPGYIRGPLVPGEWNVILGCPVRRAERTRYWVNVSLDIDLDAPADDGPVPSVFERPLTAGAAPDAPGRWYRGDFHSHTVHSDGLNTVDEYAVEAERVGLDFLAITDHNTVAHFHEVLARPRDARPLLFPGEEVTTFWGHANVWGATGWVDFRATDDALMQRTMEWVHERGALFSPNHPKPSGGYPWEFAGVRDFRTMEVWQGAWRWHNTESLELWEGRLREGAQIVAVGGSDCHSIPPAASKQPWTVGNPCTWVYARGPLSEAAVLDAVRAGHTFISEDPTGPFLELTASCDGRDYLMGDTVEAPSGTPVTYRLRYRGPSEKKLRLIRDGELWQQTVAEGEDVDLTFPSEVDEPSYVRAEVMGYRGRPERGEVVHALTTPLYLRPGR